jgi:RNA polymerase sigma-70 factor (ECF subfamily)
MEDFRTIVEEHYPILYKIGRSYTRTTADFDDLYQEMLISLYDSLKNFRQEAKLSTWIYRVALNTALTFQRDERKKSQEVKVEEQVLSGELDDQEGAYETREKQIEMLYESINELKKDDRAIILLHLEGKSYDEIAEIMGIGKSNTGVKLMRIKKQLQDILIRKGYERN